MSTFSVCRALVSILGAASCILASEHHGQVTLAAPLEKFDVASIRPTDPSVTHMHLLTTKDTGIDAVGITVLNLITIAYDLRAFQVVDAPQWVKTDRFDVRAKADESIVPADRETTAETPATSSLIWRHRLQNLLIDRFNLQSAFETRQMHVFALKLAGKTPKMTEAGADCRFSTSGRQRLFTAECMPMEIFADILSKDVHRMVVDKTGLTGKYNLSLEYTQQETYGEPPPDSSGSNSPAQEIGAESPDIYTALREQLGLKVVNETGPTRVFVIRRITRPTPN